jgi:hypothetical protein
MTRLITEWELVRLYSNHEAEAVQLRLVGREASARRRAGGAEQRRQSHRHLGPDEVVELIAAYSRKEPVYRLAERFGIHRVTVTALLRRNGVALQHPGMAPEEIPVAANLYREGWSLARLGVRFGVHPTTVWRALRAAGVKMRSPNHKIGASLAWQVLA